MPVDLLARCVRGIEWICGQEIEERLPGAAQPELSRREVAFRVPALDRAPLGLRTVDDVFLPVGKAAAATPGEVAAEVLYMPWDDRVAAISGLRTVPSAPVLDVVAAVEGHRFSRFDVEHAVGPPLAALLGGTYLRRTAEGREPGEPDLTVRVAVRDSTATFAVRLAARPLHRREWKQDTGPGTLHPPLAAALVRLAGLEPGQAVLDPFCGDGTITIETALAHPDVRVTGNDINPFRLDNAARNAARAGVEVALARVDAAESNTHVDAMVTNPPWNLAVDALGELTAGLGPFARRLSYVLPYRTGRVVLLVEDDPEVYPMGAFSVDDLDVRRLGPVRIAGRVARVFLVSRSHQWALPASLGAWQDRRLDRWG